MNNYMITGYFNFNGNIEKGYIIGEAEKGTIISFNPGERRISDFQGDIFSYNEDYIIELGDFNGHSHPEQSLYTDLVDRSWDLPTWCRNTIYKYSPILKSEHIYYASLRAFSRMLAFGVTSVMVSFYCHNNKKNEYDKAVIKAAKDTGIRLYFGRMNYDIINIEAYFEKVASQKSYYETAPEAESNFMELYQEIDDEKIVIAPAIHSIHASTRSAIVSAIKLGNRLNRFVQFHLSEDKGDVDMSLRLYNKRPIEFLVELYKLGEIDTLENMMLSDCVWINDRERELIKEYKMMVVLNPRMNDRIKTGEAEFSKLIGEGIIPFLGTDGEASNDDLSIEGERDFLKKRFTEVSKSDFSKLSKAPIRFGNANIGELSEGCYCDLKVMKGKKVIDVFVGGKKVVEGGKLLTLDVDNFLEKKIREIFKKDLT